MREIWRAHSPLPLESSEEPPPVDRPRADERSEVRQDLGDPARRVIDELVHPLGVLPGQAQRLRLRERSARELERDLAARAPSVRRLPLELRMRHLLAEQDVVER